MQLKLLSNGFRLLKVGGSLVYSTCRSVWISVSEDNMVPLELFTPVLVGLALTAALFSYIFDLLLLFH